jgi:protease-4
METMKPKLSLIREYLAVVILGLIALCIVIGGGITLAWYVGQQPSPCNVALVNLYGQVAYYPAESSGAASSALGDGSLDQTASENVRQEIESADADSSIKAIIFQVDSPGGDPVAGEDMADALKHASKPTVALIGDEGTSAAYWAATGAQTIFASADSVVADIGVTQSYLQQTQQDANNGLQFISLTAGQYKDMGNPDTPLTSAEKTLMQRDLNITFQNFIDQVAQNRNLSVASVTAIANGSSMLGQMALQDGLIDHIGNIYDVESYLNGKIGTDAVVCEN